MEESFTQILVRNYEGTATAQDVQHYLSQVMAQQESLDVTWQTIEAFKMSLNGFINSAIPDEELLNTLFDGFNYLISCSCNEDSWSNFGFELSNLVVRFLSALEKTQQFEYFYCKLLTGISDICNRNTDVWKSVSRQLLNIFINKNFSFNYFQDAVKLYILILRRIDPSDLYNFALKNLELLKNFSFLIQTVGDFESQSFILEVVFLHILKEKELAEEFFIENSKNLSKCFQNLNFNKFEADCRIFLNEVNRNLGCNRKVFTISCNQLRFGGVHLRASEEDESIWLDVNLESRRLSITCASIFETETVSQGGRCVIYLPEGNLKHWTCQIGTSSGKDCHCFRMFFQDLKSSNPELTTDDLVFTALHCSNTERCVEDFRNALRTFDKDKCGVTEDKLVVEVGADKKDTESDQLLFMPVIKSNKALKQVDFFKNMNTEKKLQDNVISSSNNNHKIVTNALDLFKDAEGEKVKAKKKSYGISVGGGGGGVTDCLEVSRNSNEALNSPVNSLLQRIASSDESSPRRSSRLKSIRLNYSDEIVVEKEQTKKNSPKVKKEKSRKSNKLFSSQENAGQIFNDGPSPPEKEAPPKSFLEFSRQRRSNRTSPKREEIKNTSLLDPNGYAFKRWSEGETTKRGQFWASKVEDLKTKKKSSGIYDFSDEESKYFKDNPKKNSCKRNSSAKNVEKAKKEKDPPKKKPAPRPSLKVSVAKKTEGKKVKEKPETLDKSLEIIENTSPDAVQKKAVEKVKKIFTGQKVVGKKESVKVIKEAKPEKAFKKAEPVKGSKKVEPVKSAKKPEPVKDFKKAEPVKSVKKAEPVKSAKKAEPVKSVKKAETVEDSKKAEPVKDSKKAEPVKDSKKAELVKDLKKTEPVKSVKKTEPEKEIKKAKPVKDSKKAEPVKSLEDPAPIETFEVHVTKESLEDPEPVKIFEEPEPENTFEEPAIFEQDAPEQMEPGKTFVAPSCKTYEEPQTLKRNQDLEGEVTLEEVRPQALKRNQDFGEEKALKEPRTKSAIHQGEKIKDPEKDQNVNLIVKEVDLNSQVDPSLRVLKIAVDQQGQYQYFQMNSLSLLEGTGKDKEDKEDENKENEIPVLKGKEKPISTGKRIRPPSSSGEISSSPWFSVKPRINFPISKPKRLVKRRKSLPSKSPPKKESSSSDEGGLKSKSITWTEKSRSPPPSAEKSRSPLQNAAKSRSPLQNAAKSRSPLQDALKSKSPSQGVITKSRSPPESKAKSRSLLQNGAKSKSPPRSSVKWRVSPETLQKPEKPTKRKFKESSGDESSDLPLTPEKGSKFPFISKLKERNRQKTKSETDRIIRTVNQGTATFLKSIYKKKSKGNVENLVEKIIPENLHEDDFDKRYSRLEKCVTYFKRGCAVTEICRDAKESISEVQKFVMEDSSDDSTTHVEEEKLQRFSTRLEAIIKCQTESELNAQLQTMADKLFNIFSLDM